MCWCSEIDYTCWQCLDDERISKLSADQIVYENELNKSISEDNFEMYGKLMDYRARNRARIDLDS